MYLGKISEKNLSTFIFCQVCILNLKLIFLCKFYHLCYFISGQEKKVFLTNGNCINAKLSIMSTFILPSLYYVNFYFVNFYSVNSVYVKFYFVKSVLYQLLFCQLCFVNYVLSTLILSNHDDHHVKWRRRHPVRVKWSSVIVNNCWR